MDQYQYHLARIMEYLAKRKQCASSRVSHQKCNEEFGAFLAKISVAAASIYGYRSNPRCAALSKPVIVCRSTRCMESRS